MIAKTNSAGYNLTFLNKSNANPTVTKLKQVGKRCQPVEYEVGPLGLEPRTP